MRPRDGIDNVFLQAVGMLLDGIPLAQLHMSWVKLFMWHAFVVKLYFMHERMSWCRMIDFVNLIGDCASCLIRQALPTSCLLFPPSKFVWLLVW